MYTTQPQDVKVAIIGAGVMAEAIASGLGNIPDAFTLNVFDLKASK
jgi:pyrroline-5-carboxylate reductase